MTNRLTPRTVLAALVACLALLAACGGEDEADSSPGPPPAATPTETAEASLPAIADRGILEPGRATHVGATWFSPPNSDAEDLVYERWRDTLSASSVGRVMVDWIDVEPEEGEYRFDEIEEHLEALAEAGVQPMVSVVAVDTSGTDFPAWLGGFEPERAAQAYLAMAEQLAPLLERHDVWLFAIANEPPLADDDDLDRGDFATFVELVVAGVHEIAPGLATTFTFAGGDPLIDDPDIDRLVEAGDALSVNHYCLNSELRVIDLDDATAAIDRLVDRAGDLPVVFQEFGCPAGASMGSSEDYQLEWFQIAFDHIAAVEQVRAAFVFEFLDWSPETVDLAYGADMDVLAATTSEGFAERLADWLLTSGLVRNDGSTRPAFDLFLETAPALAAPTT